MKRNNSNLLLLLLLGTAVGQLPSPVFFCSIGIFACWGSLARLLYRYDINMSIQRRIGNIMVSVFSAWVVGLILWESFSERPAALLAATGLVSWMGAEALDMLAKRHIFVEPKS